MDALEGLYNFYMEAVKAADEKGYADLYKQMTERLFKEIKKECSDLNQDIDIEEVEYEDGYFIFGRGTNSVVRFKIKQAPDWTFGIWWKEPETDEEGVITATCELFWQFTETIDKFKPSRSVFVAIHV